MRLIPLAVAAVAFASPALAQTYQIEASTPLVSSDTDWAGLTIQNNGRRLFIARRADGLTVFNTELRLVTGTVENSVGATSTALAPEFGRGYAATSDGAVLAFELATLRPISRMQVDDGELGRAIYEPTAKRVHLLSGSRPASSTWVTLDAATGQVIGKVTFETRQIGDAVPDGRGAIFAALQDGDALLKLRASDLAIEGRWPLGECRQPTAMRYEPATNRVLVACRGERPVMVVIDPDGGRVVATVPIGHGAGGLVFDPARRLAITANGDDATLSLIQQDGSDSYRLVETISTWPMARVLQLDGRTKRLYSATAAYSVPGPDAQAARRFHPNSFTVLTFMRPHGP